MVMDDVTNFHVCGDPSMRAMHVFMATGTRQCVPQSYQAAHSKMYFFAYIAKRGVHRNCADVSCETCPWTDQRLLLFNIKNSYDPRFVQGPFRLDQTQILVDSPFLILGQKRTQKCHFDL